MDANEKIEALVRFLNEVTCSEDLGETAAYVMDVAEEDLWEITKYGIEILKKEFKQTV